MEDQEDSEEDEKVKEERTKWYQQSYGLEGNQKNQHKIKLRNSIDPLAFRERIELYKDNRFIQDEYGLPRASIDKQKINNLRVDKKKQATCMLCNRGFNKL